MAIGRSYCRHQSTTWGDATPVVDWWTPGTERSSGEGNSIAGVGRPKDGGSRRRRFTDRPTRHDSGLNCRAACADVCAPQIREDVSSSRVAASLQSRSAVRSVGLRRHTDAARSGVHGGVRGQLHGLEKRPEYTWLRLRLAAIGSSLPLDFRHSGRREWRRSEPPRRRLKEFVPMRPSIGEAVERSRHKSAADSSRAWSNWCTSHLRSRE